METVSQIHASPTTKSVANTVTGGKSMPAVPVLQHKPKEKEEKPLPMMAAPAMVPLTRFAVQAAPPPDDSTSRTPFTVQRKEEPSVPSSLTRFNPIQKKENNTGMPDNLKAGIENLSGYDMSDVRVRYNSDKPAQLQARAYAQGTDIHIGPGQEKHLPHEAWHVVQQKQGRVQATTQMKGGISINDDASMENEADAMGMRVLRTHSQVNNVTSPFQLVQTSSEIVQMRGVTLAIVKSAIGGNFIDTANNTQSSSADTVIQNGIKYHISIVNNDPGNIHVSYYPSNDAEYAHKIMHVAYSWNAQGESFSLGSPIRAKWKPYTKHYQYMTDFAGEIIRNLTASIIVELNRPAPIAIPSAEEENSSMITPTNTPPGGWSDTPPSNSSLLNTHANAFPFQFFKAPVTNTEVNVETLKPHEVYYYWNLLKTGQLNNTNITPDEILFLALAYAKAGFEIPMQNEEEISEEQKKEEECTLKKIPVTVNIGNNGQFTYQINWALSKPTEEGGYVIQTVSFIEGTKKDGVPKSETYFYQEAWEVGTGKAITADYEQQLKKYIEDMETVGENTMEDDPHDDEFANDEASDQDSGSITFAGEAVFYDGMKSLPEDFIINNNDTLAGTLPSRVGNKKDDLLGRASNKLPHLIIVKWDKTKENGKTEVVNIV